jgi:hypothetical protein
MASNDYIYRRTAAGQSALETDTPLAAPLRRVLMLIEGETHAHLVRRLLRDHTESNIAYWLSQLERSGFLEALPSPLHHDLDFTGSFAFSK